MGNQNVEKLEGSSGDKSKRFITKAKQKILTKKILFLIIRKKQGNSWIIALNSFKFVNDFIF